MKKVKPLRILDGPTCFNGVYGNYRFINDRRMGVSMRAFPKPDKTYTATISLAGVNRGKFSNWTEKTYSKDFELLEDAGAWMLAEYKNIAWL